jgi:hypothetical protein
MILCRGKFLVSELVPGDQVQGIDYRSKRLAMATIAAVTPVAPALKVWVPLTGHKMIPVTKDTVGLEGTGRGELPVVNIRSALGFCQTGLKLVIRDLGFPLETEEMVEAVELQWEWPEYIWFEGILVGTEL